MRYLLALVAFAISCSSAMAATYKLFDHPEAGLISTYDYGLRLDGLDGVNNPRSADEFWSFESEDGASLAKMNVDFDNSVASVTGQMRNNNGGALWDLSISMTGVESLAGIGAGAGSFGATGYTGTLSDGSTTYDLVGKGKNVHGTVYEWTLFFADPGSADFRAPNITAGWVSSIDGGTNMLSYTNDFIATVAPVPVPAAGFLLIGGLGALGLMRRRQTNAA